MKGHDLVIALVRTSGKKGKNAAKPIVEVTDCYGLSSLKSPCDCIHLISDSENYVGTGSMHRVRSISYQEPEPIEVVIEDSGFDGFARYPLPDQSTVDGRILRLAA